MDGFGCLALSFSTTLGGDSHFDSEVPSSYSTCIAFLTVSNVLLWDAKLYLESLYTACTRYLDTAMLRFSRSAPALLGLVFPCCLSDMCMSFQPLQLFLCGTSFRARHQKRPISSFWGLVSCSILGASQIQYPSIKGLNYLLVYSSFRKSH